MGPTTQTPTASVPASYLNDPALNTAQNTYTTAQTSANQSQSADLSLPTMLQQALSQKLSTNNPAVAQQATDTANYQTTMANNANDTTPAMTGGVTLSPEAQLDIQNKRLYEASVPLNQDNMILSLEDLGMTSVINAAAAAHAASTQQLIQQAGLAHQNYQDLLTKLSTQANLAQQANQLAEQHQEFMGNLGIQYGQLGLGQQQLAEQKAEFGKQLALNPQALEEKTLQQVSQDAPKMDFDSFMAKYESNPNFKGGIQGLYDAWQKANPGKTITNQQLLKYGVRTGVPAQQTLTTLGQLFGANGVRGPIVHQNTGKGLVPELGSLVSEFGKAGNTLAQIPKQVASDWHL